MSESKRFNIAVDEFEGILWRDYCDDGGYMDANEACKEIAARNEDIGRLQGELKNALARIAELEAAQQWQPCNNDTGAIIDSVDDSIRITTWGYGARFKVTWPDDYSDDDKTGFVTVDLPDDIRLCRKIQPAAE